MTSGEVKTKRTCELEPGDIFTYAGLMRKVIRIKDGFVEYGILGREWNIVIGKLSAKSQARVEYHFNKEMEKIKQ